MGETRTDPVCQRGTCTHRVVWGLAAWSICAFSGCTTVTVQAGDGRVTVEHGLGVLKVQGTPGQQAMVVRSTSLGWQSGPAGQMAGFSTSRLTLLPAGCHLVLVDGAGADWPPAVWQALTRNGVCRADEHSPGEQ